MNGKRSREALLDFLDYLARKGLMNKTTASSRKAAANKILGILDEGEAQDITALDIDEVLMRFSNISGADYTPESLSTYKSRLNSALGDFRNYLENPMGFRPSIALSGRRTTEPKKASTGGDLQKPPVGQQKKDISNYLQAPAASVSILPIPIRADLTIQVQGLPYDLTEAEASKIANVIRAMASLE